MKIKGMDRNCGGRILPSVIVGLAAGITMIIVFASSNLPNQEITMIQTAKSTEVVQAFLASHPHPFILLDKTGLYHASWYSGVPALVLAKSSTHTAYFSNENNSAVGTNLTFDNSSGYFTSKNTHSLLVNNTLYLSVHLANSTTGWYAERIVLECAVDTYPGTGMGSGIGDITLASDGTVIRGNETRMIQEIEGHVCVHEQKR